MLSFCAHRLLGLGLLALAGGAAVAEPATIELRREAAVAQSSVLLKDIAEIHGLPESLSRRIAGRVVAVAPRADQIETLDRHQVSSRLGKDLPQGVAWTGAAYVSVRRTTQTVEGQALCAAAGAAWERFAAKLPAGSEQAWQCELAPQAPSVPAGRLELRDQADAAALAQARPVIGIELLVDGQRERLVQVPLNTVASVPQWCAKRALAAGERVAADDFDACTRPLFHREQLALAGQPLPAGRIKRALRAGDALVAQDVADAAHWLRGDAVAVRFKAGAIELESRGELVRDAQVGARALVHLSGAAAPVPGRLGLDGVVELEDMQ